jgi:hypothetical protein
VLREVKVCAADAGLWTTETIDDVVQRGEDTVKAIIDAAADAPAAAADGDVAAAAAAAAGAASNIAVDVACTLVEEAFRLRGASGNGTERARGMKRRAQEFEAFVERDVFAAADGGAHASAAEVVAAFRALIDDAAAMGVAVPPSCHVRLDQATAKVVA